MSFGNRFPNYGRNYFRTCFTALSGARRLTVILLLSVTAVAKAVRPEPVYTQRPDDPEAFYFTPENYGFKAGGKNDVSEALQRAINQVKAEKNFGILFIPEGKYRISRTIYIPGAVRLIGYGSKRPEIILTRNSPGFQKEAEDDKGRAAYMFWFTGGPVTEGRKPQDAGAGTFYSAMSNIDLRIEDGNPSAVALRTHYAQHSFVSHMNIYAGNGKAGLFDAGNEMENVAFYGGDYGIYTTKASPGWPVMMVDSYFEGQRKAALHTQESGLAIVNMHVRNVPCVIEIEPNYADRLFIEDSRFENVRGPALVISNENNSNNQITLRNVDCRNVPLLARFRRSDTETTVNYRMYRINNYWHGLQMDDMLDQPRYRTVADIIPLENWSAEMGSVTVPSLPPVSSWVNILELGACGDGKTDNTRIIQDAIDMYDNIYIPQGWYLVSNTLRMKPNTCLIGLHPMGTQLMIRESTAAFSGFGPPAAILESSRGGRNILNGIGINTNTFNYRAVGLKWMAGPESLVNDVKFTGGHGSMQKPGEPAPRPVYTSQGMDPSWDNQYWSLWVTGNGGGILKDIWTASTHATNGLYISNTSSPGRIYAMSVEHHVRNEVRMKNVSNWKIYALQLEEESREGTECQPMELENCRDLTFANLYMFRVIRINRPYHNSVRVWNCENVEMLNLHNYSQIKYTTDIPVYDINRDIEVRPWELQRLVISGSEKRPVPLQAVPGVAEKLAGGFEFIEGITRDSRGNIYFSENRMRRIYRWSAENNILSMVADFPWKPVSLGCDSLDNLLVVFRYDPQPGHMIDGKPESYYFPELPQEDRGGTSFSGWGNSGFAIRVYSIDPDNPEETISLLPLVPMKSVTSVHKALYVSNRWRDFHDFNSISLRVPPDCFLAHDKRTIIPRHYDLARGSSLLEAFPGKPFYTSDEYDRRMVRFDVAGDGTLSNLHYFTEWGEFGSATDSGGNLYVADGNILIFDKTGRMQGTIQVPERPSTIQFGGRNGDQLFITGRSGFFRVIMEKPD